MIGPRSVLVDGGVHPGEKPEWIEGPHLFERDGIYYLIAAEGGTRERHSEVVFRAAHPQGPFTPSPNPILTQRDLDPKRPSPITSTGHADMVETPGGDWWAVFLGVQPYAGDFYTTGRETFLMPVTWSDGWPQITAPGTAVPHVARRPNLENDDKGLSATTGNFRVSDEFTTNRLGMGWTWLGSANTPWFKTGDQSLRLTPQSDSLGDLGQPAFVGQRQRHMNARVRITLRFDPASVGARAGLAAFQDHLHYYLIGLEWTARGEQVVLERRTSKTDPATGVIVASTPLVCGDPVSLQVEARGGDYRFAYAPRGGPWRQLGPIQDGSILTTHVAGGFTGVVIGPYAYTPSRSSP